MYYDTSDSDIPPPDTADGIVILQVAKPASAVLTKKLRHTATGFQVFGEYGNASRVRAEEKPVSCLEDLAAVLSKVAPDPRLCAIRGGIRPECVTAVMDLAGVRRLAYDRPKDGVKASFEERARRWVALDLDSFDLPEFIDPVRDIEHVIDAALEQLPPEFQNVSCFWQLTSGHGIKPGGRCRLWFWLSRPTPNRELKAWLAGVKVDLAVFAVVQPIYTAAPILPPGTADFLPARSGLRAYGCDEVEVPDQEILASRRAWSGGSVNGFVAESVDDALEAMGDPPEYPEGRGFHAPIKAAFSAAIRADGSKVDQAALLARIDEALADRGHTRPATYIEARKRDATRWMEWWVQKAQENEAQQAAGAPDHPHYRRPHLSGDAASKRLRRVVRAWLDRVERYLAARDWIDAEAVRIEPDKRRESEARILAKLIKQGIDSYEAEELAGIRAARVLSAG